MQTDPIQLDLQCQRNKCVKVTNYVGPLPNKKAVMTHSTDQGKVVREIAG